MTNDPLAGVRAKISRALTHEQDLRCIEERIESQCEDAITREHDRTSGHHVFRIGTVPTIPDQYTLILGDALHNLRSSLDHLAVVLATSEAGSFDHNTEFPIMIVPHSASTSGPTPPQLRPAISMPVRWALDEVQPYRGSEPRSHWLHILHRLDVTDKHRRILVGVVQPGAIGPVKRRSDPDWNLIEAKRGPLKDGDVIARAVAASDAVPDHYPASRIGIEITEPEATILVLGTASGWTLVLNIRLYIEQNVIRAIAPFLE